MVGKESVNRKQQVIRICEAAFLQLLGYIKTPNASSANHMWQEHKKVQKASSHARWKIEKP